jgi:hypothetical protein
MNRSLIGVSSIPASIELHEFLSRLKYMNLRVSKQILAAILLAGGHSAGAQVKSPSPAWDAWPAERAIQAGGVLISARQVCTNAERVHMNRECIHPEFLSYLLSAMDDYTRCVPKGRDFDNPRRQPGARRPIKPLIAPTGRYLQRGIMEKTFVDPYARPSRVRKTM